MPSTASQTDIANRAITKIGGSRIGSLDDNVEQAKIIKNMWQKIVDRELRAHVWNFAVTRTTLAALADVPSFDYKYQYAVPADFLRLLQVNDYYLVSFGLYRNYDNAVYKFEGNKILTNFGAPLKVRYVRRIYDTYDFDPAFEEVLACKLACEMIERLINSASKRQLAAQEYKIALQDAISANALEQPPSSLLDTTWLDSRL